MEQEKMKKFNKIFLLQRLKNIFSMVKILDIL